MPCCPCPTSKYFYSHWQKRSSHLNGGRDLHLHDLDGVCPKQRNQHQQCSCWGNHRFYFWQFLLIALLRKRLRPHYWDFTLTKIFKTKKSWIQIFSDFSGVDFDQKRGLLSSSAQTEHAKQNGLPWQSLPGNGIGKVDPVGRLYRQQELFCINKRHRWSLGFVFTRNHVISDEAIMVKIILIPQ